MGNAEDSAETKARLLDAAIQLYARHGVVETSVQEIVGYAGLTKGALYHHFKSKAHLLEAVHDQFFSEQIRRLKKICSEVSDQRVAVADAIVSMFSGVVEFRSGVALFMHEYPKLPDEIFAAVRAQRDEFESLLVGLIEDGIEAGVFRTSSHPQIIAFGIIGMCAWSIYWFDHDGTLSAEQVGRELAELVVSGLAVAGEPTKGGERPVAAAE